MPFSYEDKHLAQHLEPRALPLGLDSTADP